MASKKKPEIPVANSRPKIWIVGGGYEYIRLFYNLGCDGAKNLEDADVVLFTGGEDVNPELYGEPILAKTFFNRARDAKEKAIFEAALERDLPMVGICRGGQFLNVMNKGSMYQHVTNHALGEQRTHKAFIEVPPYKSKKNDGEVVKREIEVTSTHHQMMIPGPEAMVLLTARESYERQKPDRLYVGLPEEDSLDTEAVFYDATNCLCFQPHPEFSKAPGDLIDFFEECLDNFVFPRIPLRDLPKETK